MVSLTGQIFGTVYSKDWSKPVKTDQKQTNWKWSHVPLSGFWDRSQFWDWLTGQNSDRWKPRPAPTDLYSERMVLTRSVSSSDCATIVCRFSPPFSFFLNTMFGGDLFSLEMK